MDIGRIIYRSSGLCSTGITRKWIIRIRIVLLRFQLSNSRFCLNQQIIIRNLCLLCIRQGIICSADADGRIVTGKTSELLGASSALHLNALKELAGIDHDKHVISPEALKPIQALKTEYLGSKNPRLHSDETLIALSISAADNEDAKLALQQIPKLKGCQVHTSVLLSQVDILEFRKLGVELTCEPKSEHAKKLQK